MTGISFVHWPGGKQEKKHRRFPESVADTLGRKPEDGPIMIIVPHDDDLNLGFALWVQAALNEGFRVIVLVTTDGSAGWCTAAHQDDIALVRRKETEASASILGLSFAEDFVFLDFPDCDLGRFGGMRPAKKGEPEMDGYTGMQYHYVRHFLRFRPSVVMFPTAQDLHPDHQDVARQALISVFHAEGLWLRKGEDPLPTPRIFEGAVYCPFDGRPTHGISVPDGSELFRKKLESIGCFESQEQIASLIARTRDAGGIEFLQEIAFEGYDPRAYRWMFS